MLSSPMTWLRSSRRINCLSRTSGDILTISGQAAVQAASFVNHSRLNQSTTGCAPESSPESPASRRVQE